MACQTPFRDDSAQVLLFKIASCLAEGGGLGAFGVASFNGRVGIVTLTAADVSTALGCTPLCQADGDARYVLKAGDTMTGSLNIANSAVLVASDPALDITQTWNNAAVTFTGLAANYTLTAASSNSNLFNFQVDGVDRFNFTPGGSFRVVRQDASDSGMNLFLRKRGNAGGATNALASDATIGTVAYSGWNGAAFVTGSRISGLASEVWTGIANGSRIDLYTTPIGSVTEQIALRLDSTGQAKFLEGTAALPAITFQSDPDTGIYRIGANAFAFSTDGVLRWIINSSGHLIAGADNTYDIGMSPSNRPRDLYFMGSLFRNTTDLWDVGGIQISSAAFFYWNGRSAISSPSDGVIRLSNNAVTDFNRLQFGGTTSSFPSIKRSAATLQFRLADDSAFAGIATAAIVMSTAAPLSITSGANQRAGNATLVAGTVTVANTSVTANTVVLLTRKTAGGTIGTAITYTVIAATSFTINSDSVIDTSTFSYMLVEVP